MLRDYTNEGALGGPQPFRVRCDRTTMSQQDLDEGLMRVEVELSFVNPIEVIVVSLQVADGGVVSTREEEA